MPRPDPPEQPGTAEAPSPPETTPPGHADAAPRAPNDPLRAESNGGRGGLAQEAARSGILVLAGNVVEAAATVGSMVVLARLLDVEAFGQFAMASVVASFLLQINTMGIWAAIVQRPTLSDAVCQRVFRLSVKLNLILVALLVVLGPAAAWFFGEPIVAPLIWVLSLGVCINGIASVPDGLVRRQMRYGIISVIDIISTVTAAAAAILIGYLGYGAWALVTSQLGMLIIAGLGRCVVCGWRPRLYLPETGGSGGEDEEDIGGVMRYGRDFTLAKLIRFLGRNADQVILGRLGGPGPLGLYSAAYRWAVFPVKQVHTPMLSVCVSSFSRLQDDPERLRVYVRRAFTLLYSLILPALALLFIEAESVIRLLLGEKWLAATGIFRWLLVGMAAETPLLLNKYVYYSDGRTGKQARWTVVESVVMAIGAGAGAGFGLGLDDVGLGVAAGHTLSCWLLVVPSARNCAEGALVTVGDILNPMTRPAVASFAAGAATWALMFEALGPLPFVLELAVAGCAFSVLYAAAWVALPGGGGEARVLWKLFHSLRGGRKLVAA